MKNRQQATGLDLRPDQSLELLKALHILTRDGAINQDSRRKLKQVNHLIQFIEPLLQSSFDKHGNTTLVDHGAGKSYLGFLLYDAFHHRLAQALEVIGIESRAELVERSTALARDCGFERMRFHALTVEDALHSTDMPERIDVVTALHACNTATDDAIAFGLHKRCNAFALVPCCQAEVAATLRAGKQKMLGTTPLSELWRHPLHTREMGSQVTNVLRCLQLEASGYDVTVTELVGWEHSMKNELILALRNDKPKHSAGKRLQAILESLGLEALQARFAPITA
jgi:hypothetical protein